MSARPASGNVSVDADAQMYDAIIVGARCAGSPFPLPDLMSNDNVGRIMAAARDMEFHR